MQILFERSFSRDLKKIKDKHILDQINKAIEEVEAAASPSDLPRLRKLEGFDTYFRIRVENYRIGIEILKGQVIFVRVLNRKEIYRYFP
ncbi:MAG: type II toxin-antitoxin system RelE/ParE family toxin [Chloroflexi bacterium]|nr:type II toxin-antitoxin system RelE/ParE family toxin [Chloroflexota bacterium]